MGLVHTVIYSWIKIHPAEGSWEVSEENTSLKTLFNTSPYNAYIMSPMEFVLYAYFYVLYMWFTK